MDTEQKSGSPNTNVLLGLRCPSCRSWGPFDIVATAVFLAVQDSGTDQYNSVEWSAESPIRCCACGRRGQVQGFASGCSGAQMYYCTQIGDFPGIGFTDGKQYTSTREEGRGVMLADDNGFERFVIPGEVSAAHCRIPATDYNRTEVRNRQWGLRFTLVEPEPASE